MILWNRFKGTAALGVAILLCMQTACYNPLQKKKNKNKNDAPETSPNGPSEEAFNDAVTFKGIELKLKSGVEISEAKKELAERINNEQEVSRNKMTELVIEDHVNYYNSQNESEITVEEMTKFVEKLRGEIDSEDQSKIKVAYEAKIREELGGNADYNVVATSVANLVENKEMQCYSGTILHQLVMRKSNFYYDQNPMVIFEKGHALVGFMNLAENDEDFHLNGIETTLLGKAQIKYGSAKKIKQTLRAVNAEAFILMDIFKGLLKNESELATHFLKEAAKDYSLVLPDAAKLAANSNVDANGQSSEKANINTSPFGFGSVSMVSGPIPRATKDSMEPSQGRGENGLEFLYSSEYCAADSEWKNMPEQSGCADTDGAIFSRPFSLSIGDRESSYLNYRQTRTDLAIWSVCSALNGVDDPTSSSSSSSEPSWGTFNSASAEDLQELVKNVAGLRGKRIYLSGELSTHYSSSYGIKFFNSSTGEIEEITEVERLPISNVVGICVFN